MVPRIATAALLVAALGVAGCSATGSSSSSSSAKFTGAQGDVAKVVSNLQQDGQKKDANGICTQILSRKLVDALSQAGTTCAVEMKKAIQDADDFDLTVQKVTVSGTNATALVQRGKNGPTATFRFVRENGAWKATDFGTT